jgi:hypothetical protein
MDESTRGLNLEGSLGSCTREICRLRVNECPSRLGWLPSKKHRLAVYKWIRRSLLLKVTGGRAEKLPSVGYNNCERTMRGMYLFVFGLNIVPCSRSMEEKKS